MLIHKSPELHKTIREEMVDLLLLPRVKHISDVLLACESPIEMKLGWALALYNHSHVKMCSAKTADDVFENWWPAYRLIVSPQVMMGEHRVDFYALTQSQKRIVIECDGHEFHEKTKEQAARDKSRERTIVSMGCHLLRFTGSEIWRDPMKCASEIVNVSFNLESADAEQN